MSLRFLWIYFMPLLDFTLSGVLFNQLIATYIWNCFLLFSSHYLYSVAIGFIVFFWVKHCSRACRAMLGFSAQLCCGLLCALTRLVGKPPLRVPSAYLCLFAAKANGFQHGDEKGASLTELFQYRGLQSLHACTWPKEACAIAETSSVTSLRLN